MNHLREAVSRINWDLVLYIEAAIYNTMPKSERLRHTLKTISSLFLKHPNIDRKTTIETEFLFFKSMKRDDYDSLFNSIYQNCPYSRNQLDLEWKRSTRMRLRPLYTTFKYLPAVKIIFTRKLLKSIYLAACAIRHIEVAELIFTRHKFKNLVVFADMQPCDNLISQLANLSGITTTTLQHGLYIDYSEQPNINVANYKNSVCTNFLAWGSSTKNLIKKYHPEKNIIVCGKPIEDTKSITDTKEGDYLSVIFDQNLFKQQNQEMLKCAYYIQEQLGIKINIRLHPRNNPRSYRIRKSTTTNESIENSRYIIGHTSSLIHEVMRQGKIVFKYHSKTPCISMPDELLFETPEALLSKIQNSSNSPPPQEIACEHITAIGRESLEQYRKAFECISVIARP